MERNAISTHEVRVYHAIKSARRWLTNREIQEAVPDIANRTVRAHTLKLSSLGLIDQAQVFPGHRFRWSETSERRNPAYCKRLESAAAVFGAAHAEAVA